MLKALQKSKRGNVGEAIALAFGILIVSVIIPVAISQAAGGNLSTGAKAIVGIVDILVVGVLVYAYIKKNIK